MKTIFVPTDFSTCANNATLFAMHLGKSSGAKVILYHSIPIFAGIDNNIYNAFYIDDYYESKKNKLKSYKELLEKNEEFAGVTIETTFSIGPSIQNIIEESIKLSADIIVMGTHGSSGITEILLGSNTASAIAHSEIPILAIPEGFSFAKMSENFVFATDFNSYELNKKSKDAVYSLINLFDANLKIVHVISDKVDPGSDQEDRMAQNFLSVPHKFYYLKSNDVAEAINKFSGEFEASLVATVAHKYSWLDRLFMRSVSKQIAYHSRIPLLTLYELG
jgi:nucleotide-binding universal stress UspA family protein